MKLTVALDLDGTVADYPLALLEAARMLDIDISGIEPPTRYDMIEPGWFPSKAVWKKCHDLVTDHRLDQMSLLNMADPAAITAWRNKGHTVNVVTARMNDRPDKIIKDTANWLNLVGIPFDKITLTNKKWREDCHLWIDDAPYIINDLHAHDRDVVIIDQAYNRHVHGQRAMSVAEVLS